MKRIVIQVPSRLLPRDKNGNRGIAKSGCGKFEGEGEVITPVAESK
jgi:hypothetical protein